MLKRIQYRLDNPSLEIGSSSNLKLFEYWHTKCDGARPARWPDIDLMDLFRIARNLLIRDAVEEGEEFRTRYLGTAISEAFHRNTTGRLVRDDYPDNASDIVKFYQSVLLGQSVFRIVDHITIVSERDHINYEAVCMPLLNEQDTPAHIISAYDFDYKMTSDERQTINDFTKGSV